MAGLGYAQYTGIGQLLVPESWQYKCMPVGHWQYNCRCPPCTRLQVAIMLIEHFKATAIDCMRDMAGTSSPEAVLLSLIILHEALKRINSYPWMCECQDGQADTD